MKEWTEEDRHSGHCEKLFPSYMVAQLNKGEIHWVKNRIRIWPIMYRGCVGSLLGNLNLATLAFPMLKDLPKIPWLGLC